MGSQSIDPGPGVRPGYLGKGTLVYEPISVLGLRQRLGRLRYACYQFSASLVAVLVASIAGLLSASLLPSWVGLATLMVVTLSACVYMTGLMVRRLHDMDRTGWWALVVLLPLLHIPFCLYLYLADGSSMMNRYGTPNPPPGLLVLAVGGIWWLLNVLALTAMIVVIILQWLRPEWIMPLIEYLAQYSELALPIDADLF